MTPSFVCWLWQGKNLGDRPYRPEHVNTLMRAVARNMSIPHRFICVADSPEDFDKEVEVHLTPPEALELRAHRSPEGGRFPSCYRRLWNFSEGAKAFGDYIFCVDVDFVPVRDMAPIFDRSEDFVGWRPYRDWGARLRFGGGSYLLKPGTRTEVWNGFRGPDSIRKARIAGYRGSDQAWISYCLAKKEPFFGREAGIYSIRDFMKTPNSLPKDARLVHFNGPTKPWASKLPWVLENWI